MKVKDKKALYESIMMNVSKMVKKAINEYGDGIDAEDEIIDDEPMDDDITVYVPLVGCECKCILCNDEDGNSYYEVHDDNDDYVCEVHDDVDPEDEDALVSAIEDNYQWETQSGDYENVDPLGPSDDEDSDNMDDAFDDYEDEEDYDV